MKLQTYLLATAAAVAAVPTSGAVSDHEIIETLLHNNYLISKNSHKMLVERTRRSLSKRDPPKGAAGGTPNLAALLAGMGRQSPNATKAPISTVPEVQDEEPKGWKEAKRRKIRYGPYRIPPTSEKNLESQLLNVQGMSNTFKLGAKKPCDAECTILALFADIEYADGKLASNKDGAWFHHAVLLNSGPTVLEPNCGKGKVENIFMSGNERTTGGFALPGAKIKSGYSLTPKDSFILTTELMNMDDKEKWVWLTITYEYLDGPHPDFKQGKTVWMSISAPNCAGVKSPWGPSNLTISQQPKLEVFSEHSIPWTAPKDGWVLSTGGHMHDGGVSTEIFKNKDRICNSVPTYVTGKDAHGMGGMRKRQIMGGHESNTEIAHIGKQAPCLFPEGIELKQGDQMYLRVNYDFKQHPGMKNKKGELDEIMGIVGTLVAF